MNDIHLLLLGFALGTIPSADLARLFVAALGGWLGVKPREVRQYSDAASEGREDG
jgi:hypothetical protein